MLVAFDTSVTDFDKGGTSRYIDALLPALWLAGWEHKDLVWRGTVMRIAHRNSPT